MPTAERFANRLKPHLAKCGYQGDLLQSDFQLESVSIPLAGFACHPRDTRSSCVAVAEINGDSHGSAMACKNLAAPAVFVCYDQGIDWWKMTPSGPIDRHPFTWSEVPGLFRQYGEDLNPNRIYKAKLRTPGVKSEQLWFFDVGLMPAVELNLGKTLLRVIVRSLGNLQNSLGHLIRSRQDVENVYRTVFWLLAAKVLHDKEVQNFIKIDLCDVDMVFKRIGKYHGFVDSFPPFGRQGRRAIERVAKEIASCGSLSAISSESLAYVYENALIDPKVKHQSKQMGPDIRKELGIHSTPSVLVDHMLAQLWPLIEEIPVEDRHILEPACGHAPFLVAAMRWMRDFGGIDDPQKCHHYLKGHLHGIEADPFAIEIARLSLLLADAPRGNHWNIKQGDMFDTNVLTDEVKNHCHILLSNPPYEKFSPKDQGRYSDSENNITAQTKAVELLNRTLPHLPPGGVFGVVVPQGVLHSQEAKSIRKFIAVDCELSEISLFADNLFEHADHEVAILLGRRNQGNSKKHFLYYRRVREQNMAGFKERLAFGSEEKVYQTRLVNSEEYDFRVPELDVIWRYLRDFPQLSEFVKNGQGIIYHGKHLPKDTWTIEKYRKGYGSPGFAKVSKNLCIFNLPDIVSMNLDLSVIRSCINPTNGIPQVLRNYAPVDRGPWRLKAIIDNNGYAFTSRFVANRPLSKDITLEYLWAILNSPVANAYAYCHSTKRETLVGTMRKLPVPRLSESGVQVVSQAVRDYFSLTNPRDQAMSKEPDQGDIRHALLRVDAEVLKLYDLPPRLERQLLDLFNGVDRKGVGCQFNGYFPPDFTPCIPLREYISESYRHSTAGEIIKNLKTVQSKAAINALDRTKLIIAGD